MLARSGRDRLRLIITSRVPPSFKIRREEARGSILRIDAAQLAFSLPECHEALKARLGRDVDEETAERFWRETSGWCVSVGLLPNAGIQTGFTAARLSGLSSGHRGAFQDYFREELHDRLDADFANFLCETSLFEVLTTERCAAIASAADKANEALYSHLLGNSDTALSILRQVRDECHRLGLQSQIPKLYMLDASIHLAMGRYRETMSDVDQCIAAMREFGGYSLQVNAYVGRFRGLAMWYLGDRAGSSLPPIRVEMLGGFSVSSKGRMVRFNRSNARLLFQHLLVAYPRGIHEEVLIEHLWPEGDPSKGRANLRTTIKDLRKALDPYSVPRGPSYVTYAEQHYGLELPAESHVDYLTFVDLNEERVRMETSTSISDDDRMSGLRAALKAYRGPLLPMLPYESFTVELRERLQSLHQRGSLKMAELLVAAGSLDEAASVVEGALAYDPLWTDGVRLALRIYAMQGELLKAMRAYRSYEKRLQDELALAPDEDMREHFHDLMKLSKG